MTGLLDPALIDSHDLFHARYGRGAVIVAIRRDTGEMPSPDAARWHQHVARLYNARNRGDTGSAPAFEPVFSIQEETGFVRVTVQFEYRNPHRPSYNPVSATIERVIPLDQVTLEIVRAAARKEES